MNDPIRVLVADDHPALRIGMKAVIKAMKSEATLVGLAADGVEAVEKYRELRPDVMTLDLRMPGLDGLVVLQRILTLDPSAKILILTMYDNEEDVFRSIEAGAKGFITKASSHQEIVRAIRIVSKGERCIPDDIARKLASRTSTATLTQRELEVLDLMRLGITNKEIAESLDVAPGTVKTHVRVILTKLGAMSRTEAVNMAIQRGILR